MSTNTTKKTLTKHDGKTTVKPAVIDSLTASVPDISVRDAYINRSFPGGRSDFDVFEAAYRHQMNVLIEGPTGPGKTTAVKAFAAHMGLPFYRLPSNVGFDPSQFFGRYVPDGMGGFRWIDGPVTVLARHGGVLLINEVNFLPARVATVLFGLLDASREIILLDHENEVIRASDKLVIFADMNPGYDGTRALNAAFRNRFDVQLSWGYDPEVEKQLIKSPVLRDLIANIRASAEQGVYRTPVATNMAMEFEKMCGVLGFDFAAMNFANHFEDDERESVRRLIEAKRNALLPEMPQPEETEDEKMARRERMKPGDYDPEYGVLGTDWAWGEDDEEDEDDEALVAAG